MKLIRRFLDDGWAMILTVALLVLLLAALDAVTRSGEAIDLRLTGEKMNQ